MSDQPHKIKILSWGAVYESLLIAFALTTFFGIRMYISEDPGFSWQTGVTSFIFTFLVAFSITAVDHALVNWFQVKFPWQKDNVKRITIEFVLTSITAAIIISIIYLAFLALNKGVCVGGPMEVEIMDHIAIAVMINLIMLGIAETNFMVKQWKESIVQQEKLKRENAESKYQALNNQVNPHFLFNSLNTLTSLIVQSQKQSLEFVHRFSAVYRYVLDTTDKTVVDINEELQFIHSYLHLQEARYGDSLKTSIGIKSGDLNKLIPPLSMQLLIENAIKHNEISKSHPILIHIYTKENFLVIENNYQPRKEKLNDTGKGIKNLEERYAYLTEEKPFFGVKDNKFVAKIPLLEDE
jgi:two-component system LytT family sensor kinase